VGRTSVTIDAAAFNDVASASRKFSNFLKHSFFCLFDNSIGGGSVALIAAATALRSATVRSSGGRTVPTIVPETRQNSIPEANSSQFARFVKSKKEKDFRGNSKAGESRLSV
jgi:hypothetical protein